MVPPFYTPPPNKGIKSLITIIGDNYIDQTLGTKPEGYILDEWRREERTRILEDKTQENREPVCERVDLKGVRWKTGVYLTFAVRSREKDGVVRTWTYRWNETSSADGEWVAHVSRCTVTTTAKKFLHPKECFIKGGPEGRPFPCLRCVLKPKRTKQSKIQEWVWRDGTTSGTLNLCDWDNGPSVRHRVRVITRRLNEGVEVESCLLIQEGGHTTVVGYSMVRKKGSRDSIK